MSKLEQIRDALNILAAIIERDGPQYLPLFKRLEAEEAALLQDEAVLARALSRAKRQT